MVKRFNLFDFGQHLKQADPGSAENRHARIHIVSRVSCLGAICLSILSAPTESYSQVPTPEPIGLSGKVIKALSICGQYIYAATDTEGVYRKNSSSSDTGWSFLGL